VSNSRFYIDFPLEATVVGTSLPLPKDVAHHASRVLRLAVGATIRLFDGRGGEYRAAIDRIGRNGASAHIDHFDPVDREWAQAPILVQAVIASDPMDVVVRKAVELGVASIVPVTAARSQGGLVGARGEKRLIHWRSIAIAACEQCGRNRIPSVDAPMALDAWLNGIGGGIGPGVIAGPGATVSLAAFAARTLPSAVLVGPEGGFTDGEMALAVKRGLTPVHLGPRVLRADTAAIAALAVLAAVAGDGR
jgi:16S rRNA (uracil1498-N3)-methyltransferase